MRKSERMMFMYWNQRHLYGHTRVVKTGSPAFWPHDVMRHPAVVETATRNKASGTTLSALTHSFVTATSGDHSKINMNAKTAYKSVDDVVASAALRAVKLHLWYLTPELLPLCLFSSAVDDHLKAKIVKENVKHPKKASMTNRDGTDVSSNPPRKKIQPPRKDSNPPRLGVVLALKGGLRVVSEQKLY